MDTQIRIMFLVSSMHGGGAQRVISHLLQRLDRKKFRPILVLIQKAGPYLEDIPDDVEIVDLKSRNARFAIFKLNRIIRRYRPDIMFSTLWYLNIIVGLVSKLAFPEMVFIARETDIPSMSIPKSKYPKLNKFLYEWIYPRFDYIVCQCEGMKQDLLDNFCIPEKQIVVINNPVNIKKIWKVHLKEKTKKYKGGFNVVAIGRLSFQKGFDLLLKAFAKINEDDVHLTILGEGKDRSILENMIIELGLKNKVEMIGFQSNPFPYMQQAQLMILSSRFEPFPNAVLEANACGTPVLAFDSPGGVKEIIVDGLNGWLVENENIPELSGKILQCATNEIDRTKIIKNVYQKYDIDKIIDKYEKLFLDSYSHIGRSSRRCQ